MKTCSYCGNEYPDDATACAIDGEVLIDTRLGRKKVTGVWRGVYGFAKPERLAKSATVSFTLRLMQGWMEKFTGSVIEDAPLGAPGTGSIDGYFSFPNIEFTKQMPIGLIIGQDGTSRSLREHILAKGYECEQDLPGSAILYQGTLLDRNRMQGIWIINARRILLPGGCFISMTRTTGYWCAEFVTADTKANPTGGPTEPLFNKCLLSPQELNDIEGVAFCSIGKFNVIDAKKILGRFEREDVRFEVRRTEDAIRQIIPIMEFTGGYAGTTQMVEVFIHPEDVEKAVQIVGERSQT